MKCFNPQGVLNKDNITVYRPCGVCCGCRLSYAAQWSVRCWCEAQCHEKSCFITLTYSNENLPEDGSVKKEELQLFIKRLRRLAEPEVIRFFGCGEYGEKGNRPHYHVCVFGFDFSDKTLLKGGRWKGCKKGFKKSTDPLYRSDGLESLWKKGYSSIGELTEKSAGYVARYCMKKIGGDKAKEHYGDRVPEFSLMSRMPGIGQKWFEEHINEVYPKDYISINGKRYKVPRYFDDLLKKMDEVRWRYVRLNRKKKGEKRAYEDSLRLKQREDYWIAITKDSLVREIERVCE